MAFCFPKTVVQGSTAEEWRQRPGVCRSSPGAVSPRGDATRRGDTRQFSEVGRGGVGRDRPAAALGAWTASRVFPETGSCGREGPQKEPAGPAAPRHSRFPSAGPRLVNAHARPDAL